MGVISMKYSFRFVLAAAATFAFAGAAAAQTFTQPGQGKTLFDGLCQDCHGPNGASDQAPALNHALGQDDATLRRIIRDGMPERGMPRVRRMTEEEVEVLASYVRSLGAGKPETVAGNATRGAAVYARLDCTSCHTI